MEGTWLTQRVAAGEAGWPGVRQKRRRWRSGRLEPERGAALVELAFVLPVLLMLTFGMITSGIVYNHKLDLVHAAREGARYGATLSLAQCTGTPNPCGSSTWAEVVQQVVVERATGGVTATQVCVALVTGNTGTPLGNAYTTKGDGTACYSDGNGDTDNRVQVSLTKPGEKIDAIFFRFPVTLTSRATTKYEQ